MSLVFLHLEDLTHHYTFKQMFNRQASELERNSQSKPNNEDECIVLSLMNQPLSLIFA